MTDKELMKMLLGLTAIQGKDKKEKEETLGNLLMLVCFWVLIKNTCLLIWLFIKSVWLLVEWLAPICWWAIKKICWIFSASYLYEWWGGFAKENHKKGIIVLFSMLFVITCLLTLLLIYNELFFFVLLMFGVGVVCYLPENIIKVMGSLKGVTFALLAWVVFGGTIFGVNYIADMISIKSPTKQEVTPKPIKLVIKGDFINLRQSPNGNVVAKIYKKDSGRFTIKILDSGNKEWAKVLYLPPNVKDENKAIIGYIHSSYFTNL